MNKIIVAVFGLYALQFMSSCIIPECPEPKPLVITYNGLEVKGWNTSGFQNIELEHADSIDKCDFGISIKVLSEAKEISTIRTSSFGMDQAIAWSCPGPDYHYSNRILSIEVLLTDVVTSKTDTITNRFKAQTYYGEKLSLSDLSAIEPEQSYFRLALTDCDSIPNISIFSVNINLDSGNTVSNETEQIHFLKEE
ncbi:hypothetical protein N9Y06_04525 [Flavobacteriales bacterium]|nr:hypothetical protein [Flavobacteriales bacterium]